MLPSLLGSFILCVFNQANTEPPVHGAAAPREGTGHTEPRGAVLGDGRTERAASEQKFLYGFK